MGYIIQNDYQKQIQPALLSQVTGSNAGVLASAEQAAEAEIRSYLAHKYDLDKELAAATAWSSSATYKAGDKVYDGNDVLYHAKYPFVPFSLQSSYKAGDKVWWKDSTYECRISTAYLSHEAGLQHRTTQGIPAVNVLPDNVLIGAQYWANLGSYQVVAGTALGSSSH